MTEFKTPTSKKCRSRVDNPELQTPIKIPPSPYLQKIGYGCGVSVFTLQRSPKVGVVRSPWAIKKVNRKVVENKKYDDRIRLEAEILRNLKHPNIVGFRGVSDLNGEICLAMEKLEISLGDMIEERFNDVETPFEADDILKIGFEMAKGLEYLHHTVYILHGDVKSYNILVSKNFEVVKLCDFGVSVPLTKSLEIDTSKGNYHYIGTECWSAPEVIDETGPVTNKADMWAYGLVLWEMIALTPPHLEECEESTEERSFDDSIAMDESTCCKENDNPNVDMDDSIQFLKELFPAKYGTRPPLPALDLGPQYRKVLELFYACSDSDYKTRPSAKGVVMFFKNYTHSESNENDEESVSNTDV